MGEPVGIHVHQKMHVQVAPVCHHALALRNRPPGDHARAADDRKVDFLGADLLQFEVKDKSLLCLPAHQDFCKSNGMLSVVQLLPSGEWEKDPQEDFLYTVNYEQMANDRYRMAVRSSPRELGTYKIKWIELRDQWNNVKVADPEFVFEIPEAN